MERVFWLLSGGDGALVKSMMEEFQNSHRHTLPANLHKLVPVIFCFLDLCNVMWESVMCVFNYSPVFKWFC